MARNYDVLHYFYGDNLRVGFEATRKYKVVATVHMDIMQKNNPQKFVKILNSLDAVIALSSNQKNILEQMGVASVFIPHGFNKPVYKQTDTGINKNKVNVVVSGSNYRDVKTLLYAIDYCDKERRDIQFHLLGQPDSVKQALSDKSNVTCYPRLADDMYFSVIASCDYSFLPLTFATANNALLEVQFLGIQGILPSISGIEDYAAPAPSNLKYSSLNELLGIFNNITKKRPDVGLIDYAKKFQWSNIYSQLLDFYEQL